MHRTKASLVKGRWHGVSRDGGIVLFRVNPPVSFADSPLYTRGPFGAAPQQHFQLFFALTAVAAAFASLRVRCGAANQRLTLLDVGILPHRFLA